VVTHGLEVVLLELVRDLPADDVARNAWCLTEEYGIGA
jgi:hypothetical protein